MPNTWIWLGRDVSTAIGTWKETIREEGTVYRTVHIGDRILWWKAGKGAGFYGIGTVTGKAVFCRPQRLACPGVSLEGSYR